MRAIVLKPIAILSNIEAIDILGCIPSRGNGRETAMHKYEFLSTIIAMFPSPRGEMVVKPSRPKLAQSNRSQARIDAIALY